MHRLLDAAGINSVKMIEPRKGEFSPFPPGISQLIIKGLKKTGITSLYKHQAEAISGILAGNHIVITTNTASGKSMTYTTPDLNAYLDNPGVKALYLTPAKALGQNQKKTIKDTCDRVAWPGARPGIEVCDGDTDYHVRKGILNNNNFVVTTPDMLHASLLPKHFQYNMFFQNLSFVIIDEAHTYRGIFGNNVCHVIRRLLRICSHYGASPVFILCTATIANPGEFAKHLVGLDFAVVSKDTSPSGPKKVVFYEPPQYEKEGELKRRLTHYEAARALGNYIEAGHRVIMFGKSRKVVESAYKKLVEAFPDLKTKVTPYKGTLVPEERRRLERDLFQEALKGVITTNALELGIDIGALDVCILSGFPGSISSTWQQAGRAGRNGQEALIVIMAGEDPLDLFLVRNSAYFFSQPCEKAIVSPEKVQFLLDHLLCASRELPLTREDSRYWSEAHYYKVVKFLYEQGSLELISDNPKRYCSKGGIERFGLRGESDQYSVVTPGQKVVERYEYKDLLTDGYPGCILNIMGSPYMVKEINFDSKEVYLSYLPPALNGSYTFPVLKTGISILTGKARIKLQKSQLFPVS